MYMIWSSWVLSHINHCGSFHTKSFSYIYIKDIGFGWVGFHAISYILGHLMPNPVYIYIYKNEGIDILS